jgi:hypothetical protein
VGCYCLVELGQVGCDAVTLTRLQQLLLHLHVLLCDADDSSTRVSIDILGKW